MGFWKKLQNLLQGKGWKEDEELQRAEEIKKEMEAAETIQPDILEKREEEREMIEEELDIPRERQKELILERKPEAKPELPKKAKIETVTEKIDDTVANTLSIEGNIEVINDYAPYYRRIFTENAKLNDPDVLGVLVESRGRNYDTDSASNTKSTVKTDDSPEHSSSTDSSSKKRERYETT